MGSKITASDNKRLAKNTVLLYGRTLLVMAITLFTSRVILESLGIEDYGTYNVIGGFVAMFSMVGGTLITATQRFINVELGKKEDGNVNKIFNTAIGIHTILVIVLLLLFETFGLWFLNHKMSIPEGRLWAANIVFQCSIIAFVLNILSMPFNAIIIAFERMKAFAYITLLDAVLKLGICYLLFLTKEDRLILYAILLMLISIMNNVIYYLYCKRQFPEESRLHVVRDKESYIRQTSFAGYTFLGSIAAILATHGVNVVLNLFCGVTVNAARGVAVQVQHAVTKFVNDFMTALKPQITKTYASGEVEKSMSLVYRGAKFSYFLLLILSVPILFKTSEILTLWLKKYPDYSTIFVQLTLIYALITVLSTPLTTIILATGKIKSNALIIGGLRILILPLSYLVLKLGFAPYSVYIVMILIDTISIFTRLFILKSITGIKFKPYIKQVLIYTLAVSVIIFIINFQLCRIVTDSIIGLLLYIIASIILSFVVFILIGLTGTEGSALYAVVNKVIHKRLK